MSLALGNRQLAMLREMGVRVWQPAPPSKADAIATVPIATALRPAIAINTGAARARIEGVTGTLEPKKRPAAADLAPPPSAAPPDGTRAESAWQIGALQSLYPAPEASIAPRWLVLLEAPASALQASFNAFEGDAGKLLGNMLRATGMHARGVVQLAPLVRGSSASQALPGALLELLASQVPDVLLVMGRLAAQAVLQSAEPLAKLRGQVHALPSGQRAIPTIVTLDPAYLLRNPLDKAKAWDDLCLALSLNAA